jgi:hypothetical protein
VSGKASFSDFGRLAGLRVQHDGCFYSVLPTDATLSKGWALSCYTQVALRSENRRCISKSYAYRLMLRFLLFNPRDYTFTPPTWIRKTSIIKRGCSYDADGFFGRSLEAAASSIPCTKAPISGSNGVFVAD